MTIHVCIAGATGWAGSALTSAVHQAEHMALVGAVSRNGKGKAIGDILGLSGCDVIVSGSVGEALSTPCDVMVEYAQAN